MSGLSPRAWLIIRLGLSGGLLWLAFRGIDWPALVASSQQVKPRWLGLALCLVLVSNTLAACRWGWIMRQAGLHQPWQRYIGLYFAGGLINQGVPSTLGGDTYRAVQGSRGGVKDGPSVRYGLLAVLLDRGMGLLGNVALGALGLVMGGAVMANWLPDLGALILVLLVGALLLAGALFNQPWLQRLLARGLKLARLPAGMPAIGSVLRWPVNLAQLLVSLTVHFLTMATFGACLLAYGVEVPLQALMIGLPALGLLLMLPISISGWGLRETTLSAVLLLWNVPNSATVLSSVTYGLIVLLGYLPATWILVKSKKTAADTVATTKIGTR